MSPYLTNDNPITAMTPSGFTPHPVLSHLFSGLCLKKMLHVDEVRPTMFSLELTSIKYFLDWISFSHWCLKWASLLPCAVLMQGCFQPESQLMPLWFNGNTFLQAGPKIWWRAFPEERRLFEQKLDDHIWEQCLTVHIFLATFSLSAPNIYSKNCSTEAYNKVMIKPVAIDSSAVGDPCTGVL